MKSACYSIDLPNAQLPHVARKLTYLPNMRNSLTSEQGQLLIWQPMSEVAVDCYLSSSYDDPKILAWNGPSLLSPLTRTEDIFNYATAVLATQIDWLEIHLSVMHGYTGEPVAVSPFFLPRVEQLLGNLGRCRRQILEAMNQYTESMSGAEFQFHIFAWPSDSRMPNPMGGLGSFLRMNWADAELALDPDRFVGNISCSF